MRRHKKAPILMYTIIYWIIRTLAQALLVFYFTKLIFGEYTYHNGHPIDSSSIDMFTFTVVICVQTLTIIVESNSITIVNSIVIGITFIGYFITISIANVFDIGFKQVMFHWFLEPQFWFALILLTFITMAPIYLFKFIRKHYISRLCNDDSSIKIENSLSQRSKVNEPLLTTKSSGKKLLDLLENFREPQKNID